MAENQITEIISAYAAGCLDRENFIQFKEYYKSGGELPLRELGELQNTLALVPIILEIEKPRPALKAEIAKKLIALQDEIKEKIKEQKRKAAEAKKIEEARVSKEAEQEAESHFEQLTPTLDTRELFAAKKVEEKLTKEKNEAEKIRRKREQEKTPTEEVHRRTETTEQREVVQQEKSFKSSKLPWILTVTFLIIAVAIYFLFSGTVKDLNTKIATQEKQIKRLQKDLALNKKMVTDYKELLQFLKNKEIAVVELTGGEKYPNAMGRLLISFRSGDGVLILENPPKIKEDEAYQLWLVTEGKSLSLDVLPQENDKLYYFIFNIPTLPKKDIQLFRITNEPKEGSVLPLGNTLLYGQFVK